MAETERLCADAVISSDIFMRFSLFDTFVLKKRWRSPALFAGMMGFFAALCYMMVGKQEQAALLGTVLLCIGLVLPTVYVVLYIFSVRNTAKKLKLGYGKKIYSFAFGQKKMTVRNEKEKAEFPYGKLMLVYFDKKCTYIYSDASRAFLLPDKNAGEDIRSLLVSVLPAQKIKKQRSVTLPQKP